MKKLLLIFILFSNLLYSQDVNHVNCISGDCNNGEGTALLSGFNEYKKYSGEWKNGKFDGIGSAWLKFNLDGEPLNNKHNISMLAVFYPNGGYHGPIDIDGQAVILYTINSTGERLYCVYKNSSGLELIGTNCNDNEGNNIDCKPLLKLLIE